MSQTLHLPREGSANEPYDGSLDDSSGPAATAETAAGPAVVVRRRKISIAASNAAVASLQPEVRAPRVFRVAQPLEAPPTDDGADDGAAFASRDAAAPADDAMAVPPRRRRRMKPAPVTIIRPNEGAAREAVATFGPTGELLRRTQEVQRELQRLRIEAESLRAAEARAAVAWIRKAIAEHGIDVRELGL